MQRNFVRIFQNNKMILAIVGPIAIAMFTLLIANLCGNAFHREPAGTQERIFARAEEVLGQSAKQASGTAEKVFGGFGWVADKAFEAIEKVSREPNGKD